MPAKARKRSSTQKGTATATFAPPVSGGQAATLPKKDRRTSAAKSQAKRETNWLLFAGAGLLLVIFVILIFGLWGKNSILPGSTVTPTSGPASPTGRISFVRGEGDNTRNIYVMDPDGSRLERVTNGIYVEGLTTWSPDGKYIAAQISQDGISTIARISVAPDNKGGEVVALTADMMADNSDKRADSAFPAWSPDGSMIAFQSKKEGGSFQVYVMDREGNNKRKVSSGQAFAGLPSWSPDGKSITYVGGDKPDAGAPKEIYVVSVDGGTPTQLTKLGKDLTRPTWSPDGKSIVYLDNLSDRFSDIMIMNADGTAPRKLADGVRGSSPQFNPAGDTILYYFVSLVPLPTPVGGGEAQPAGSYIYTVPVAGGEPTDLTPGSKDNYDPSWSPDSTMLTWASVQNAGQGHKIVIANADGSNVRAISSVEGDDYQPKWAPPPK